jgi:signal peptidase I
MRWFWFATFTLICSLLSVFLRQPLILLGELLIIDLFITRKIKLFSRISQSIRPIPAWINLVIWLIVTIWVIRVLAIDSITIQSPAVKPALQAGDQVLVSKIHYGPRLPVVHRRLSGLYKIKRGDLLAYNFPEGDTTIKGMEAFSYYSLKRKREIENDTITRVSLRYQPVDRRTPEVNRCIGLPGDTINILAGQEGSHDNGQRAFDYIVEVKNRQLPMEFLHRLGLGPSEVQVVPEMGYVIPLRLDQIAMVKQRPEVTAITAYTLEPGRGDYNIFPHDARYLWNRDNFGPVIVPRKGDSIRLTLLNIGIYQRIIEVYEKNRLEVQKNEIFINGSPATTYTIKQDYYFVLGDNRHHSRDSRHWGFLPADHIIGKPILIWLSTFKETGQPFSIYWNRIFNLPK